MSGETPAERREAAATRRRWVSLAEIVAVAGVVIAALTLWNSWSERRDAESAKVAAESSEAKARTRVEITATVQDDGRSLLLKDAAHDIQDARFAFPKALGVTAQKPVVDPSIDVRWFEDALLKLTDGGADERAGRLPVFVTTRYWDGDVQRSATGIYDVVWRTEGRLLRGRTLRLEGLRLRQRGGTQARIDALWAAEKF